MNLLFWRRKPEPKPERHHVSFTFGPGVPLWEDQHPEMAAKYRERGMEPPHGSSDVTRAYALLPYEPRWLHQQYAQRNGYFWLPCPICTRPFGGHEIVDTYKPDPINNPSSGKMICPVCTCARNGGTLV